MDAIPLDNEPPPMPPIRPDPGECCNSGCNPCIFDLYEQALERYQLVLHDWQKMRQRIKRE